MTSHIEGGIGEKANEFLLAAVPYSFGCEEEASRLSHLSVGLDTRGLKRVMENASYHKLEPLLHCIGEDCKELGYPLHLPQTSLDIWSRVYEREIARSALIYHGARKAMSALEEIGVRAIILKGVYLASHYYENEGARAFRDLDLLVEKNSLPALNEALLASGFLPHPGRPSFVPAPAFTVYYLPMDDSNLSMEIDIHIGLHWPEEYFLRTSLRGKDLWSEASPDSYEGISTWSMSTEHLVITTLLDAAVNHRFALLIKFRDIIEIIRKVGIDWGAVSEWCGRWEVRSFVGPGLELLKGLLSDPWSADALVDPTILPGDLGEFIPSYALMKLFLELLSLKGLPDHRARSFSLSNLLFFMLADTWRERARGLVYIPGHVLKGRRHF